MCKWCGEKMPHKEWSTHERSCEMRKIPCDAYCDELITFKDMNYHIKNTCKNRFIACPLKCGYKAREVDINTHLEKECDNRMTECPNKCMTNAGGATEKVLLLPAKQVGVHLRVACPERELKCGLCQLKLIAKDMHFHSRNDCEYREVQCRCFGCLKVLPYNQREDHEKHKCKFRLVLCPAGCGLSIMYKKLERHVETKCDMKRVACVAGCGQIVPQGQMSDHLLYECVRRVLHASTPGKKKGNKKPSTPTANAVKSSFGFELDESYRREEQDETFSLSRSFSKGGGTWKNINDPDDLKRTQSSLSLPPI
jgi:hypothetical protein